MAKTKAYGYLRVSSRGQLDGDGFDRQEEAITRYAAKHGIEIVDGYFEEGVSGTKDVEDRPAFQEMLSAILSNGIRVVVVESLDRLAREYRIQESLLVYLASKDITLINARTEEDVTAAIKSDPMKKALIQMQGIFSELEKAQLVRKLKVARDRKRAKTGRCEGRRGYLDSPELLESIVSMRDVDKMTFREIAFILNHSSDSQPKLNGTEWTGDNVWKVYTKVKRRAA